MNAKLLPRRAGMLFVIAVAAAIPVHTGAGQNAQVPQALALATQAQPAVVDSSSVAPLDLMLFVHRPDLPLRALSNKHKDHS